MYKKCLFLILNMFSVMLVAADGRMLVQLPPKLSGSGVIIVDRVDINQIDEVAGVTFKELIDQAQADNSSWVMVAYSCQHNGALQRRYASQKTINQHSHFDKMQACSYYKVTKDLLGKYTVTLTR